MRAFYRCSTPCPDAGWPSAVVLSAEGETTWLLAESDPCPALEALGAVRLGARLWEISGANLDMCEDPDRPGVPRTIFAGDALEDYQ